jgi:CRISPR/Cas system Type II protein with McrA/HNH and RuvC-like nuclease domain
MSQRERIFERDKGICGICKHPIEDIEQSNIDHIIPLSRKGENCMENKQIAHIECNQSKGNKIIPTRKIKSWIEESDAPQRLWNEIAVNGFKNLSYNLFLQHFKDYKNHNKYKSKITKI